MQYTAKKGQALPDPPPFELGPAPDAVAGRIVGEALRLGGHADQARDALIAPYIRGERDPRLLAALGLHEKLGGRDERAAKFLEAAVQAKVVRPRAYFELARLRFIEAVSAVGDAGSFNEAQTMRIIEPLLAASHQPPPLAGVFGLMADTWLRATPVPNRNQFDAILQGVVRFQNEPTLVLRGALVAQKAGFAEDALRLAEHGAKIARDPGTREQFEKVVAELKRDAAPADQK